MSETKSRTDSGTDEPLSPADALVELDKEYPTIERMPGRCAGQPILKDTRLRVSDVLNIIVQYADFPAIMEHWGGDYSVESWQDAVRYARDYIQETVPLDRGEMRYENL